MRFLFQNIEWRTNLDLRQHEGYGHLRIEQPNMVKWSAPEGERLAMILDSVFARVNEQLDFILPPGMRNMRKDLEKILKSALQDALTKMDMVTRDEFTQQTALLEKTRLRITELENRLRALETRVREMESARKL